MNNEDLPPSSNTETILITFPFPLDVPKTAWDHIQAAIKATCDQYEVNHPDRVMWQSSSGGEGTTDAIGIDERQDYYGNNPHNPEGKRLRAESRLRRQNRPEKLSVKPSS